MPKKQKEECQRCGDTSRKWHRCVECRLILCPDCLDDNHCPECERFVCYDCMGFHDTHCPRPISDDE